MKVMSTGALTLKERRFLREWRDNAGNATEAYVRLNPGKYSKNRESAAAAASRLLRRLHGKLPALLDDFGLDDASCADVLVGNIGATKVNGTPDYAERRHTVRLVQEMRGRLGTGGGQGTTINVGNAFIKTVALPAVMPETRTAEPVEIDVDEQLADIQSQLASHAGPGGNGGNGSNGDNGHADTDQDEDDEQLI